MFQNIFFYLFFSKAISILLLEMTLYTDEKKSLKPGMTWICGQVYADISSPYQPELLSYYNIEKIPQRQSNGYLHYVLWRKVKEMKEVIKEHSLFMRDSIQMRIRMVRSKNVIVRLSYTYAITPTDSDRIRWECNSKNMCRTRTGICFTFWKENKNSWKTYKNKKKTIRRKNSKQIQSIRWKGCSSQWSGMA